MKKILPHLLVLLLYSVITIVATYPQIRHMKQGIYSISDQLFYAWAIERNIESILHKPLKDFYDATIFYPYNNTLSFGDHLIGETLLAFPFYIATQNPIFAENVLILASFVLSAYGAFLLVKHFNNNVWIAIAGGVLFSFSHVRFNQYDHLNILSTGWLPFVFLYLQKYLEKWKVRDLVFLCVFYILTIFLTMYYLIMTSLAIAIYIGCWLLINKSLDKLLTKKMLLLFFSLGFCVLLLLPSLIQYVQFSKTFPEVKRLIQDNVIYSANLLSYFTAARITIASRIAHFDKYSEADAGLFPGLVVIIGATCALIYGLRHKNLKIPIFFAGLLSLVFFVLSLGPFLKFTSESTTNLPLPYFYLYYLLFPLQIMRVPARFAIFSELFLVLFACYGFTYILNQYISPQKKWIFITLIIGFSLFETWSVPLPLTLVETKQDFPQVYYWLKDQPDKTVVLELPIPNNKVEDQAKNMNRHAFMENLAHVDRDNIEAYRDYFSLLHGKRIVNGYSAYAPPIYKEIIDRTIDFPNANSLLAIEELGVDYVIIHTKQYFPDVREKIKQLLEKEDAMEVVKQFDDDIVVKVL